MRKVYLFVMALFAQLLTFNAFAQTDEEYEAALAAIEDGTRYYITTEIEGEKYYLTYDGNLSGVPFDGENYDLSACDLFTLEKNSAGGFKQYGFRVHGSTFFSNPNSSSNIDDTSLHTNGDGRDTWEVQVFFLGENGKYAVRSTNATSTTDTSGWNWCGSAFWAVKSGDSGPYVGYSFDVTYVWELEQPTGFSLLKMKVDEIEAKYNDFVYEDRDEPTILNMGTEFGQLTDYETWGKFWDLMQEIDGIATQIIDPDYDYYSDPDALTMEEAEAYAAKADSLYLAILDSEVPYALPNGDGYYRIIAHTLYKSTYDESGFVNKAFAASFEDAHKDKSVFGTLRRDRANYLWKLTQHGDSILMQNAGLGTYVSFSSPSAGNVVMTADEADATHVMLDYAGWDYTELDGEGEDREILCIRLASEPREKKWPDGGSYHQARYMHQAGHASKADDASPWGTYGTDTGTDQELTFWRRTFDYAAGVDTWTSEWFLEYVPDEEAEQVIADFEAIFNHDVLVAKNQALRDSVNNTLTLAKDIIRTKMITNANQLSSPYSDSSEGQHLEYLIDNDVSTFWHTTWHGLAEGVDPFYYYGEGYEDGIECHYLQLSGMDNMVGDCELYLRERDGADNDRVKTLVVMGTDNLKNEDEDWDEILRVTLPHTDKAEENTVFFHMDEAYPYLRVFAIETAYSSEAFRTFWHASEIQFYTVVENPNSQFNLMGEIAQDLQDAYDANCAIADEDLTVADYEALKAVYEAFMEYGLVDPAELRAALAKYVKATEGVVEGTNPGEWADKSIADAYDALYAEVDAYNKAGRYDATEIHKYAVMLKAMQKSVMEQANGVETDKWYRITVPTEEMYDAYSFSKEGVDKCNDLIEGQWSICGNIVTAAKLQSEDVTNYDDEGNEVTTTNTWLEAIGGEDLRESDRLFFMAEDEIEDKDVSMFRFVELESDAADYTPVFSDVKENILMALDMSATYKQGDPLITNAAQFSSNASYPGNDGQKLESGCLIDNNFSTYWHSDYGRTYCCIPYLQVALNEPVSGLIQVYIGRRNAGSGHVTRMYVQGSNDAETWTNIGYIETPYTNVSTPAVSQPLDLGGTFSHLRFSMTQRYGTDGGSNIEFDPFDETITADDYNTKYTYFHCSEFQIYPVTPTKQLTPSVQALQDAYTTANKVVLKDATAEDLAAVAQAYQTFRDAFNAAQGKNVLPKGLDKAPSTYAIQNKATGLYVFVNGTGNQNNIYLKTIPTLVGYKALGYERSLLSARTLDGVSCNNLHIGESNRRFCTWGSTEVTSNSGLVIAEADEAYEAPTEFTFTKDVKPGRIIDWCHSITLTPEVLDDGFAYAAVGQYTIGEDEDAETFLAVKALETIPAGEPALYILGDTTSYDAEDDYVEPVKFTFSGNEKPVLKGTMVNGLIGTLVTKAVDDCQIYFDANHVGSPAKGTTVNVTPCSAVLDLDNCPQVEAEPTAYDFSICLGQAAKDVADGVKDIASTFDKISQRGNVYSIDGRLLMTNANLSSLKTLGRGMYILNGVKVYVK